MFLPIGDSPNPSARPWLTWTLIAVNVLIHIGLWPLAWQAASPRDPNVKLYLEVLAHEHGAVPEQVSAGDLVRFTHGFKPVQPSFATALSAMFLHASLLHLLGNMLFLWIFGNNIEHRLGRLGFLCAYLATGIAATLGDALLRLGSAIPSVGASGAISGVLGLYFAWFPHNRVRVWVFLFPFFMNVVELSARFVLVVYVVVDNLLPLLLTQGQGGVAYGAHLGGFIAGWLLAKTLGERERRPQLEAHSPVPFAEAALAERFRAALSRGELRTAAALLFTLPRPLTQAQLSWRDKVWLGEALAERGDPRTALAAFQRALSDHPQTLDRTGYARAHLGAARILLRALNSPTAAYQHLYAVLEADPDPEDLAQARELLAELEQRTRSVPRYLPR